MLFTLTQGHIKLPPPPLSGNRNKLLGKKMKWERREGEMERKRKGLGKKGKGIEGEGKGKARRKRREREKGGEKGSDSRKSS